jgi:hypothetical protein
VQEALHRSIVPDVAGAAHLACNPVVGHQPLELLTGILAVLVGVVQQRIGLAAPQPLNLLLLGLHLAVAWKRRPQMSFRLANPFAQHVLV